MNHTRELIDAMYLGVALLVLLVGYIFKGKSR
jgi:hypothetical protein